MWNVLHRQGTRNIDTKRTWQSSWLVVIGCVDVRYADRIGMDTYFIKSSWIYIIILISYESFGCAASIHCRKSQENNRSNITWKIKFASLFNARCTRFDQTPNEAAGEFAFGCRCQRWTCNSCSSIFQICQLGWCVGQTLGAANQTNSPQWRWCLTIWHKIHKTDSGRFARIFYIERKRKFNISGKFRILTPFFIHLLSKKISSTILTKLCRALHMLLHQC